MNLDSEEKKLQKLKEGDEECFRNIYDEYHRRLYGIAFKYLKSKDLAEDAVHDVFVKLWNHRKELDTKGSLKGFLFTSVKNHVLNMIRDRKRDVKKNQSYASLKTVKKNNTKAKITLKNYRKVFQAGLKELPQGKREIFSMKMDKDLSNKEIARELDISVNTVKSQYYKASQFIKDHLSQHTDINFE